MQYEINERSFVFTNLTVTKRLSRLHREFPYTGILSPADASAVILTNGDGLYVMQRRDKRPGIFYPGYLGLFGGACEKGEDYNQAAVRELREELSLELTGRLEFFSQTSLGFEPFGHGRVERVFFTGTLSNDEVSNIRLGEGAGVELVEVCQLLTAENVAPYDAFAIWLHCNSSR